MGNSTRTTAITTGIRKTTITLFTPPGMGMPAHSTLTHPA
jgi:hypothetical protein